MYDEYDKSDTLDYVDNKKKDNDKLKKIIICVLMFCFLVVLIIVISKACSKNEVENPGFSQGQTTPTISLNKQNVTLEVLEEINLEAQVLMSDNENPNFIWYSEDSSVAVVSDDGLVVAKKEGKTNIVVSYYENGKEYFTKCSVLVTNSVLELESINFTQEVVTLGVGSDVLLQVKVEPIEAKVEDLIFTSDNPSVATVSETGRVTGIGVGVTTISVKTSDSKKSDTVLVNVSENGNVLINPMSLQLIGLTNELKVGGSAKVETIITPSNATNVNLTWLSSNTNIATVDANGIVTGIKSGNCTIIASTSNNLSAKLDITVHANNISVTNIEILGDEQITMDVSGTKKIEYKITPANATLKEVIYTSSNSSVATVDSKGVISANSSGSTIITVKTVDGNLEDAIFVTVKDNNNDNNNSSDGFDDSNSGSSSSSSSSSSTCSNYSMIKIKHNGSDKGAIISTISFEKAKKFPTTITNPTIEITSFSDCLSYANYYIYHGVTEDTIREKAVSNGTVRSSGQTIALNNGAGYYRIEIKGYNKETKSYLTKIYYAVVDGVNSVPSVAFQKISEDLANQKVRVYFTAEDTSKIVPIKAIRYCQTTGTSCTPTITLNSLTSATYVFRKDVEIKISNLNSNVIVCYEAVNTNEVVSTTKCGYAYKAS